MSVTVNDNGELVRVTEWGVEPLTVNGTPVKANHTYCHACGAEFAGTEQATCHMNEQHLWRDA